MVKISKRDNVIWVEGEVDMACADELRDALEEGTSGPLIVDVSNLRFMDSSGLKVLLLAAASRNGNGNLILRRPQRAVLRVLEILVPNGIDGLEVQE